MKGKYDIYDLMMRRMARVVRDEFGIKDEQRALQSLFHRFPDLRLSLDGKIMSEELYWKETSRHVIFPRNTEILYKLFTSRFSLEKSSGFTTPHKNFVLAFPKGYEIDGTQAKGVLVTYMPFPDRMSEIHERFCDYLKQPMDYVAPSAYADRPVLTVAYQSPYDDEMLYSFTVPERLIPECLSAGDPETYYEVLGAYPKYNMDFDLDERDRRYQYTLFQLIIRLSVYAMAYDGALVDGYPDVRPKHLEPKGLKYRDTTLRMPALEKKDPKAHYRSWHFRQLVDERFYRGEHGNKPVGSRIVFVKDTVVGQKVEPETLKEAMK